MGSITENVGGGKGGGGGGACPVGDEGTVLVVTDGTGIPFVEFEGWAALAGNSVRRKKNKYDTLCASGMQQRFIITVMRTKII